MSLTDLPNNALSSITHQTEAMRSAFFETTIRLGVTGLARAGKTVFITSLIANLLAQKRLEHLKASAAGRIETVILQPQPDDTIPRFEYEAHLGKLIQAEPEWPQSTRNISQLRISLRLKRSHFLASLTGARIVHIDIVDYPGEWLLDLALMDQSYEAWSQATLTQMRQRPAARTCLEMIENMPEPFDEQRLIACAKAYRAYLQEAQEQGHYDTGPGRFLLPGELEGSPVLTFVPLPKDAPKAFWDICARRYSSYTSKVVQPFFNEHFARLDRQVVLLDVLGAIERGPMALEELRLLMSRILPAFKPGRTSWLGGLLGMRRIDHVLFGITKSDHLHSDQHEALQALAEALVDDAARTAQFNGAKRETLALSALRTTRQVQKHHQGQEIAMVQGRALETGKPVSYSPGRLPPAPGAILQEARLGATTWRDFQFAPMNFAPPELRLGPQDGLPHIRLDRACEFLFGDVL